jgi:tetratricopeptide (TPR) repeat protein
MATSYIPIHMQVQVQLQITPLSPEEFKEKLNFINRIKKDGDYETAKKMLISGIYHLQQFNNATYNSILYLLLAKILFEEKNFIHAEPIFREGFIQLEIRSNSFRSNYKLLNPDSYNHNFIKYLITVMNMFSVVLDENGKKDELELILKEILAIKQHIYKPLIVGGINESTLRSVDRIAIMLYNNNKYEDAVGYFQSSFNWKKIMYGTCNKETLITNNYLCSVLKRLGRFDEADYYCELSLPNLEVPLVLFN